MVLKGQFLERATLIPVERLVLEGLSHRGEGRPPLLILPPRPDEGGSMDHVLAAEIAWAAATAGHPTLRFNFRGVGASQGKRGTGEQLADDAQAALRLLGENASGGVEVGVPTAVAAIGGSAQVALALSRRHPSVVGLCLVSPLQLQPEDLIRSRLRLCAVVPEHDPLVPRAALAAALAEAGGTLEVIEGADRSYTRNLPRVGAAVVAFLKSLEEELGD
ncbi:MAG: alpha/beta hydrolase [Myxococcales bacterium]|nr:alpha/beta hydrolase [Myxococcales bacterium]